MFMNEINPCNKIYKEYIFESLMILLKDNPFNKISITGIAKKAGVSRMTYYRYYKNKEDIIRVHINDIFSDVNEYISENNALPADKKLTYYFTRMNKEKCFINNLVTCGLIGIFKTDIVDLVTLMIDKIINYHSDTKRNKMYAFFIAGGIISYNIMVSCSDEEYTIDELVSTTLDMINNENIFI